MKLKIGFPISSTVIVKVILQSEIIFCQNLASKQGNPAVQNSEPNLHPEQKIYANLDL